MAAYTTIDDPSAYFKVQLYTGNGSANHAITFDDTDTDMQPDFVWIKNRDATDSHCVFDAVRGATKVLHADTTAAEATDADTLDSFTSDGFQVDADVKVNTNTEDYVAWSWKESATAGFDIVSYTGNGTDDTDISHSLSAVPHVMIVKNRETVEHWAVYHHKVSSDPETDFLKLNLNSAVGDDVNKWSDEAPTSSVFTVGSSTYTNEDGVGMIAYLFSEKQGFSKFGSYTGNGNADGPFIYTGFRPAFVMIKCATRAGTDIWTMYDNKREGYNVDNDALSADTNAAERTSDDIDILSNGFKCRNSVTDVNPSGETAVYIAFAEAPFVNSSGVPCNAR